MKKHILTGLVLAVLLLSVLSGCGSKATALTSEQAQQIALETAGLTNDDTANIHTHVVTENGIPCYNVHINTGDKEFSFLISAADGTILASGTDTGH